MPNFTAAFTSATGIVIFPWDDPPYGERARRINPAAQAPHRHTGPAINHQQVEVTITPDGGSPGDLDMDLDASGPFTAWFAEAPGPAALWPVITHPLGKTTVWHWTPYQAGHYTFIVRRHIGGLIVLHFDVDPPTETSP